ncbi:MAG: MEMO1 family protein [Methyloprofundus sp.]|nr:MAG: MEMO1 family protein [Methyloprofundus sp.]
MPKIRPAAVAGSFYPADPQVLTTMLENYLQHAKPSTTTPKAIIVPHAGYIYSGAIAASAYVRLQAKREQIMRVVLLGPAHKVGFVGLALSSAELFNTPLGDVPLDTEAISALTRYPFVYYLDQAHTEEHSLEVHLPFLQISLQAFKLIPIVVGDCSAEQVRQMLEAFYDEEDTLIVISSDLSHYHDYATAQNLDAATSAKIEQLDYQHLDHESACGCTPISGLLALARQKSLTVKTIDLRNSGDTAGDKNHVVGYGAYVIE